ncbi:glycerol kinase GlpK [Fructilactobacillus cliffordii]|uniref:glycerol kinase GlpK n=1 Tax=Fructilactobacillus cliffordii TaxID=2940299 RepID=UPI00209386B1|nr:glycerol kinase GlpK [Fructilactobacillus cliffordii]USS86676.1 glycerol kinase GlpK [Fructilactobacillus cliffordii]
MKNEQYILAIDEGTTSVRAILFNRQGQIVGQAQRLIHQSFPHPGWVEQDPIEIWNNTETVISEVLFQTETPPYKVRAIGISNQRETTVVWNRKTGKPIHNAIVWQSKQTSDLANQLKESGYQELIQQKTGLLIDSYFSATKIQWLLDQVPQAREQAEAGDLLFGTIDTWLLWKLTNGHVHATDMTNASRTMLYNIHTLEWDEELLNLLHIPKQMLPDVEESSHFYGYTQEFTFMGVQIPITGIAGDQQASLFGELALEPGMTKNTYGTGAFIMMNLGTQPQTSTHGLLTTIAYSVNGEVNYAFEGSVFTAGAAVDWLKDQVKLVQDVTETAHQAQAAASNNQLYVVPAFNGLGAPYWNQAARGAIFGITQQTDDKQLVKATLESLAFQTRDVLETMSKETGLPVKSLMVDGGVSKNEYLMQFQADILDTTITRAPLTETTALGVAYLAGLQVNYWTDLATIKSIIRSTNSYQPKMAASERKSRYAGWQRAVQATQLFAEENHD